MRKIILITGLFFTLTGIVKSDGLPGEFILSDQWRTMFNFHSPLSNPSFMVEQQYGSIRGIIALAPDNIANLWEAGMVIPLGYYQALGVTVLGENGRTVSDAGTGILIGDSAKYLKSKNDNYLYTLSYANNLIGHLSAGVNLNLINQGNFGEPAFAVSADLGLSYRLIYHPLLGFHIAGVTFQNLISTKAGIVQKFAQSAQVKIDYFASFMQNRYKFHFKTNITDILANAENFTRGKKMEWDLFFQLGVRILPYCYIHGFSNYGDSKKIDYFGVATEFDVPQLNAGRDLSIIYQYRNDLNSKLNGSHSLYLRAEFGNSREGIAASKIAKMLSVTANELYNKAMKFYHKEDFWNAYLTFMRLQVAYPDFFRNDYVGLYSASCLEKMDMREEAVKEYIKVREAYPSSSAVPFANLGIMRVFYRQRAYDGVSNYFAELNRPSVSDSLKFHGYYLMGESLLRQSEYRKAIQYFEMIPDQHPDYIFAQNSVAAIHAKTNSGFHMIAASLENCINAKVSTHPQREVLNRSLVLLGYTYYEENALSKAVTALRMVPQQSYYYEDALLGLGWTAIKARQWNDCIDAGLKLAQTSKRFVMHCEGALLQAYGHILEKRYANAQLLLSAILKRMHEYRTISADSLQARKMQYESDRISYSYFAEKLSRVARRGANISSEEQSSLYAEQVKFKSLIDQYLSFADDFRRTSFFERDYKKVLEDIEYALVTVEKIMSHPEQMKLLNKDKAISNEINILKKEMESINMEK